MGRTRSTFRRPLRRLGSCLAGAVVVGCAWLHAPPAAASPAPPSAQVEALATRGSPAPSRITIFEIQGWRPALPPAEGVGTLTPEPAPFPWPAPALDLVGPPSLPPISPEYLEWTGLRAELADDAYRRSRGDPWTAFGNSLLAGPEQLVDGALTGLGNLLGRPTLLAWEDEANRSVTSRVLDLQLGPRPRGIFSDFLEQWADRERKYLARVQDARTEEAGYHDSHEDEDPGELLDAQRKIFWDALRRTYLDRYKAQLDEQFSGETLRPAHWTVVDFVVLPPLIGGYLYYRGLSKRIGMGPTALRISIEPFSEFIHQDPDHPLMAALEWTVKGFPVGLIVSVGVNEGRYGPDFIGIGTSIGAVRSAVKGRSEAGRP